MKDDWINFRTDGDRITPMHFASFKGNINAIEALHKHGADHHARNQFGLNMLHVAAQGD